MPRESFPGRLLCPASRSACRLVRGRRSSCGSCRFFPGPGPDRCRCRMRPRSSSRRLTNTSSPHGVPESVLLRIRSSVLMSSSPKVRREFSIRFPVVEDYVDGHNQKPKPFIWTAQASDILEKVRRARNKLVKDAQSGTVAIGDQCESSKGSSLRLQWDSGIGDSTRDNLRLWKSGPHEPD